MKNSTSREKSKVAKFNPTFQSILGNLVDFFNYLENSKSSLATAAIIGTEFIVESEEFPMTTEGEAVNVIKELANP